MSPTASDKQSRHWEERRQTVEQRCSSVDEIKKAAALLEGSKQQLVYLCLENMVARYSARLQDFDRLKDDHWTDHTSLRIKGALKEEQEAFQSLLKIVKALEEESLQST